MSRNHKFSREFPSISTHRCMANRHSVFGRQHLGRFVRVSAARIVSFVPVACGVVQASHKLLSVLPHLLVEPPKSPWYAMQSCAICLAGTRTASVP